MFSVTSQTVSPSKRKIRLQLLFAAGFSAAVTGICLFISRSAYLRLASYGSGSQRIPERTFGWLQTLEVFVSPVVEGFSALSLSQRISWLFFALLLVLLCLFSLWHLISALCGLLAVFSPQRLAKRLTLLVNRYGAPLIRYGLASTLSAVLTVAPTVNALAAAEPDTITPQVVAISAVIAPTEADTPVPQDGIANSLEFPETEESQLAIPSPLFDSDSTSDQGTEAGDFPSPQLVPTGVDNSPSQLLPPSESEQALTPEAVELRLSAAPPVDVTKSRNDTATKPNAAQQTPHQQLSNNAPQQSVTVQPGDSLWAIATILSPASSAAQISVICEQLYHLNRTVIGENPNLLFPGMILQLPQEFQR